MSIYCFKGEEPANCPSFIRSIDEDDFYAATVFAIAERTGGRDEALQRHIKELFPDRDELYVRTARFYIQALAPKSPVLEQRTSDSLPEDTDMGVVFAGEAFITEQDLELEDQEDGEPGTIPGQPCRPGQSLNCAA